MPRVVYFLLTALSFAAPGLLFARPGHPLGSLLYLSFGVAIALAASGYKSTLAVVGGAMAALFAGVLGLDQGLGQGVLPTAVFFAWIFAERTLRVRSRTGKIVHVALAVGGGAFAGAVLQAYAAASTGVHGVAALVAMALVGLPFLVDADPVVAHTLAVLAEGTEQPLRSQLDRAAELQRASAGIPLDPSTRDDVRRTFASIEKLAEARIKLAQSSAKSEAAQGVLGMLDGKIEQHLAALEKALSATLAVSAATTAADDDAAASVDAKGDGLEEAMRVLGEHG